MKRNISILLAQCYIQSVTAFSLSSIHFAYYERNPVRTWARRASSTYANKPDSAASPSAEPNDALQLTRAIGQPAWKGSKLKKGTRTRTFTRRKMDPNRKEAGSWYQRDEMMQHDILTKDLETDLGQKVVLAKKLREKMINLIEKKEELQFGKTWDARGSTSFMDQRGLGYDDDGMEFMSIYENTSGDFDEPSMESWKESLENYNFQGDQRISSTLVRDGSKLSVSAFESDLELLTEEDIIVKLKVPGGKEELRGILFVGAESRTMLMRSNIRLVVSISKKWMGRSFAAGNGEGARTVNLYSGGWDRPSLDEVIQEGVLGLARAVDKFDPSRGLRFSTYSTHWITSYVRQCFQTASTGCLKVPAQLHEIKVRMRILERKQHIYLHLNNVPNKILHYSNTRIEFLQITRKTIR
jgi:RNA polymerase sigma factor (sigma-70 family)